MLPRHSHKNKLSQITEIAHRAITAYDGHDGKEERSQQAGTANPFTFKVPVTLAGLQLHAEFKVSAFQRRRREAALWVSRLLSTGGVRPMSSAMSSRSVPMVL